MRVNQLVRLAANAQVRTTPAWALQLHRSQVPDEAMELRPHPHLDEIGRIVGVALDGTSCIVKWPNGDRTTELVSQLYPQEG